MKKRSRIRPEEAARVIIQRELGVPVDHHDDGQRQHMYDLRVGPEGCPDIAIECIGAVDPQRTETWNLGPGRGSFRISIQGDWHVVLRPDARVKRVQAELSALLHECWDIGVREFVHVDAFLQVRNAPLFRRLHELKIDGLGCYLPGTGRVFFGMTGFGGAVDPTGRAVPPWIREFLTADCQLDVLSKLRHSRAKARHVFIHASFGGTPWPVESYLGTQSALLPEEAPDLPDPVDEVWLAYGSRGLRWDGIKWRFIDAG